MAGAGVTSAETEEQSEKSAARGDRLLAFDGKEAYKEPPLTTKERA